MIKKRNYYFCSHGFSSAKYDFFGVFWWVSLLINLGPVGRPKKAGPHLKPKVYGGISSKTNKGNADCLAILSEIFRPLKSKTSTPKKLYKNEILNSQVLEPYDFTVEETPQRKYTHERSSNSGGASFACETGVRLPCQQIDNTHKSLGTKIEKSLENRPNNLRNVHTVKTQQQSSIATSLAKTVLEVSLVAPEPPKAVAVAIPEQKSSAPNQETEVTLTDIPLAWFEQEINVESPQSSQSSACLIPLDISETPLSHLGPIPREFLQIKTQEHLDPIVPESDSALYKRLLAGCVPGPDPLNIIGIASGI